MHNLTAIGTFHLFVNQSRHIEKIDRIILQQGVNRRSICVNSTGR